MDENHNEANSKCNNNSTQTNSELTNDSINWPCKLKLYEAFQKNIWILSMATSCVIPIMFITIYSAALMQNHVYPFLPWISDCGSVGLQAAFFSQFIDILCILTSFAAFGRYKQLENYIHGKLRNDKNVTVESLRSLDKVNFTALIIFGFSVCMLIIPGNFRSTEWLQVHIIAATTGFALTYLYGALLVYLGNEMANYGLESPPVSMAICVVTGIISLLVMVVFGSVSVFISVDTFNDNEGRMKWDASTPGYWWHLLSNIGEWVFLNMYSGILVCNANRMKKGIFLN